MSLALVLASALFAQTPAPAAAPALTWAPFVQQGGLLFTSDSVTAGGAGGGVGVQLVWRRRYLAQADVGFAWLIGNEVVSRAAFGVQRDGTWAPAVWGTVNALWGGRIEFVAEDGRRPSWPTWAVGLRASPLRFAGALGFVSALELGYARGPSGGNWVEVTVLQAGAHW